VSGVLRPGRGAGLYVCWHRSGLDDRDHAVTDEEFIRGRRDSQGRYEALCGHVVLPTSMLVPPGRPCPRCYAFLVARSTLPSVERRIRPTRHRKPSRWHWLFRNPQPLAAPESWTHQWPRLTPERNGRPQVPAGAGSAPTAPVPTGLHGVGCGR
jgi:hypothetical protein